jgi:hypothetical protein
LEHGNLKTPSRSVEEINPSKAAPSPSIPHNSSAIDENAYEDGCMQSTSGETINLERLSKEKEALEEESSRLDEEQIRLNLRERMLLEELVQETKDRNSEKQQAIIHLRGQIEELEAPFRLEESVQEMKKRNSEKEQAIVHLREQIEGLETQLKLGQ